jgi:uncharacterized protein (TIGR00369 family)
MVRVVDISIGPPVIRPTSECVLDKESLFWRMVSGELPTPPCAQTLGGAFKHIDADNGTVETEFQGRPGFANPVGHIQGGFLAAMLDDTLGSALVATLPKGQFAPTVNLNVTFHRPAKIGVITGQGRILKRGKELCAMTGELYQDGQLIASATATAMIRAIP